MTEDEMVGWGVGDGQGSLADYSPRGRKDLGVTEHHTRNHSNEIGSCPRGDEGSFWFWFKQKTSSQHR